LKRVRRKRHALPAQGAAKVCGEVNGGRWPAPGRDLMNGLPELADGSGRTAGPAYVVMFHLGLFSRPDGLQVARKLTLMTIDLGQPFGHGDDIGLRIGHIWRLVIGHQRKPSSAAFCHMLTLARFAQFVFLCIYCTKFLPLTAFFQNIIGIFIVKSIILPDLYFV
jgi:hypothetical protein